MMETFSRSDGWGNGGAGVTESWRVSTVNESYALCPSYPTALVVPASIDDACLLAASRFRSKGRAPVLTWRHPNGAALCRAAQPRTGLGERRSTADESIIAAVGLASPTQQPLIIADARSKVAATGNAVLGKGTESEAHYLATVAFLDIANIHTVRNSFLKLHELHARTHAKGVAADYLRALDESNWLSLLASLLRAAHRVAHCIDCAKRSVLVHCSDGWDRTAQVCVLAQLLLDPHYRTLRGLATLLDKDMIAFGHKSADRNGFAQGGVASAEWSPIWLQLLDGMRQVVRQFPSHFEYKEEALAFLATHLYAGFVTSFRHNTPQELQADTHAQRSTSIWELLLQRYHHFRNTSFTPWPLSNGPLRPVCALQRLTVWELYLPPKHCVAESVLADAAWCLPVPAKEGAPTVVLEDAVALAAAAAAAAATAPTSEVPAEVESEMQPASALRFSCGRVTHASRVEKDVHSPYHAYHIEVDVETDASGECIRRIHLSRRFSDFSALDAALRAALPPASLAHLPPLPSTLTFNKFSDSVVNARRAGLDKYVRALLSSEPQVTSNDLVIKFFDGLEVSMEADATAGVSREASPGE